MNTGFAVVRLGDRGGTRHIPPEFASACHILLYTHKSKVADGLLALKERKPGYKVFTAADLIAKGYLGSTTDQIYAVFEVIPDATFHCQKWDGRKLQDVMKAFKSRQKYRIVKDFESLSTLPRILSLQKLLKARQ